MDVTVRDEDLLPAFTCEMVRTALQLAPPPLEQVAKRLLRQQRRCNWARPGGAAQRHSGGAQLPGREHLSTSVTIEKAAMRDGGAIKVIVGRNSVTLVDRDLRLLSDRLPQTILVASVGRRIGSVIDLTTAGIFGMLADAVILGTREQDGVQVFQLDLESVPTTLGEITSKYISPY